MVVLTAIVLGLSAQLRPHPNPLLATTAFPREMRESQETGKPIRALPIAIAYGATALIIIVDALTGCYLCKWCGPSSYQITGMRFYGIGNEYAGVLGFDGGAGGFVLGSQWLVPVVGLATIVVLGSGRLWRELWRDGGGGGYVCSALAGGLARGIRREAHRPGVRVGDCGSGRIRCPGLGACRIGGKPRRKNNGVDARSSVQAIWIARDAQGAVSTSGSRSRQEGCITLLRSCRSLRSGSGDFSLRSRRIRMRFPSPG